MSNIGSKVNRLEERLEGLGSKPGRYKRAVLCFVEDGKVRDGDGNRYASIEECEAAHADAEMICVKFVKGAGE